MTPVRDAPQVQPWDKHNQKLVGHVHPPDWSNPQPRGRYHLVVVGAGTGGLVTAAIAASLGARVALVERHLMGGDCLNVGCVPSKAMIRAARAWHDAREAASRFGGPQAEGSGDFAVAMERMRRTRADISPVDGAARFRGLGVDVFLGQASFTGPERLEVDGRTLHFRRAVIAAGGRPRVPDIPGLREAGYLTNETVFSLTELPRRVTVLGGGPIGCELAQAFAWFGSRVTVVEQGERILSHDDPDAAEVVAGALRRAGVEILTGAEISSVERDAAGRRTHFRRGDRADSVVGDALLVSVGRTPNTDGLGLQAAQVAYDDSGIEVDDRMRTSNRRIYSIGDIASRFKFTHVADAQARMVIRNALFYGRGRASNLVVPWCTYTSPELAHVGLTAESAGARGHVETLTIPMGEVDRARIDGATAGFLRVHLKRGGDRILGATLVAEDAGEIISQITAAIRQGTGLETLGEVIFPYPTKAEVVRKAADARRRSKLTPMAKQAFEAFFRVTR